MSPLMGIEAPRLRRVIYSAVFYSNVVAYEDVLI